MPLHAPGRNCGEADDAIRQDRNVRHCQMEPELILARVVLEEPIQIGLAAREAEAFVVGTQWADLNVLCHASIPEALGAALAGVRAGARPDQTLRRTGRAGKE